MKKNKMMRIASILLVAVLLTTSIISGTFAKYVTKSSATDSARVAKFGVQVSATGSLFSKTYATDTASVTGDSDGISVKSSENVVAPGTKNDTGLTLAVTGAPEVDVKLTVAVADGFKEVFLKGANGLPDMTTSNAEDTFNLAADYYPVKFTLKQTKGGNTNALVTAGKLSEVKTALEGISKHVDAGTDLATEIGTLTLTWEWAFGDDANNQADTLLGDLAANTTLAPSTPTLTDGTDYNLTTNLEFSITVAQVD